MILSLVVFLGLASALGGTSPAVLAATVTTPLDKTITKDWGEYVVLSQDDYYSHLILISRTTSATLEIGQSMSMPL